MLWAGVAQKNSTKFTAFATTKLLLQDFGDIMSSAYNTTESGTTYNSLITRASMVWNMLWSVLLSYFFNYLIDVVRDMLTGLVAPDVAQLTGQIGQLIANPLISEE